jgi:RNA polymerase sigma-B factor
LAPHEVEQHRDRWMIARGGGGGARRVGASSRDDERTRLIEEHLGLARHLGGRFERRGESREDLQQVASIALVRAADRFDPTLGYPFSSFAARTILGELKRHLRDHAWAVKMPRTLQELYLEVTAVVNELTQTLGRSPSVGEIARASNLRDDEVLSALEAGHGYRAESIDAPGGTDVPRAEIAEDSDEFGNLADRDELSTHLAKLSRQQRELLQLRFVEELSQAEIASRMSMSQMHVSRLLRRAVDELRGSYGVEMGAESDGAA